MSRDPDSRASALNGSTADAPIDLSSSPKAPIPAQPVESSTILNGAQEKKKKSPSPKRALSEPAVENESPSKKTKVTPPKTLVQQNEDDTDPDEATVTISKETWQGYCEIECEPAYFNVILREIGVQGVTVREVPMMDPDTISFLPSPIFGLVMLMRHREFDKEKQSKSCPPDVWFANQMPAQNSCATLAMIHTLLNVASPADIDVGEYMRQFKKFSQDLTPYQRGEAFASWSFVKKIHNSFAKKMDILENDRWVSHKVRKAARDKAKKEALAKAQATAAAAAAAASKAKAKPKGKKPTSKSRTARHDSEARESDGSVESIEEHAHHYIAFVPINGEVWKLDGMDYQPTSMGHYDVSQPESWINAISDRVMALMAAGDDDYGIFAVAQSPIITLKKEFCTANATMKAAEHKLSSINTDWRSFIIDDVDAEPPSPSFFEGISNEERKAYTAPESVVQEMEKEDLPGLLERRRKLVVEQRRLAVEYQVEETQVEEENQAAEARRWDYGPAIQAWMEMLAANGHLEKVLHLFPQGK
ncbi:cysteine proteinase [Byssothecium circinans]|uniref:Ubiquitin carboxyl-terminal hydrolase n=1 Tax=Byssothecium circinans TaxID=147558 RepID=A0A6A5TWK8_9PLEO|nr:cysteine proteinase [Byssothecium circinans]